MREGYSENNSENPNDSTLEADDNFEIVFNVVEDILRKIKNGHERTDKDLLEDLILAATIFRTTEQLVLNEWTPRLADIRELFDNLGSVLEHERMPIFSQWFKNQVEKIDKIFPKDNDPEILPTPMGAIAEPPNGNHLLDWPLQ